MIGSTRWTEAEDAAVLAMSNADAYNDWAGQHGYLTRSAGSIWNRRYVIKRDMQASAPITTPFDLPAEITPADIASPPSLASRFYSDKRMGIGDWRERFAMAQQMQEMKRKASWSQNHATIMIPTDRPIGVIGIADTHIGAWSTNYQLIERLTDDILSIPNLYVVLLGDLAHLAVKLRSVEEVSDNLLPPEMQIETVLLWLEAIQDRVLFGCWGNHESRLESQSGSNHLYEMLKRRVPWSNGMAHADVCVGDVIYKMAFSHHFRGRSILNPTHGPMQYIKSRAPERDIAWAGDSHEPGITQFWHGERKEPRVAINTGSTQLESGYAKRYFALKTHPVYPLVELDHEQHLMTPFASVEAWLRVKQAW